MVVNKSDAKSVQITSELLKQGGVVVLPTDTVYGFSAKSDINEADLRIRTIKGRSETKPFIRLIAEPDEIRKYTEDVIPKKLLSYWPGPLTIIVNDKIIPGITTAFRCPGDAWLRQIISECGAPLYSTSVNRSGKPVIQTIDGIISEFESEVDLIINGGDTKDALPSTIVKIEDGKVIVLRDGDIKIEPDLL
ncbi:MAG: threonylcarbamoyl-AMP synthase [Treponema sp.]|nr:threonylcarbamoyl-AMP synthase [Treponema sp.]